MKFPLRSALCALALGPLTALQAQVVIDPATAQPAWGCWVSDPEGYYQTHFLRCVAMTEKTAPTRQRSRESDWLALEYVRRLIARGEVAKIESFLDGQAVKLPYGSLWQTRLDSYPMEEEWSAGVPEQLARAVLCYDPVACSLFVRRQ